MPRNWDEIPEDEMLNFDDAHTGQMAQYARIFQKRTQESLGGVEHELKNLASRLGTSTDRLLGVGNELIRTTEEAAASQRRHQWAVVGLTVVIAAATVAYTWITWLSVQAMRDANEIQSQTAEPVHVITSPGD